MPGSCSRRRETFTPRSHGSRRKSPAAAGRVEAVDGDVFPAALRDSLRPPEHEPVRVRSDDDRSLRHPVHVVWEITLACNLKCAHCGSRAGRPRQQELSTDECLDVVRQLAELGTRDLNLIGGEAYLRRDWLTIVKAIADAGMHCSIQTGGRGLTLDKIKAAAAAGVGTLGISIDGPREIHDRLRGFKGSFDQALGVLRNVAAVGIV